MQNRRLNILVYRIVSLLVISGLVLPSAPFFVPVARANGATSDQAKVTNARLLFGATENVSRRTARSRSFETPQGKGWSEVYQNSIHYQNTQGQWTPINNNLVAIQNPPTGPQMVTPDDGACVITSNTYNYTNQANRYKSNFKSTLGLNYFQLQQGSNEIAFSLQDSQSVNATVANNTITYPNALSNIDLRYTALEDSIKNDIVLKAAPSISWLYFDVKLSSGLTLSTATSGDLKVTNGQGATIWQLPRPSVVNSVTNESVYGSYTLAQTACGYQIGLQIISRFLPSPERGYPVTIDPTIVITDAANVATNYVLQNDDGIYNNNQYLYVGNTSYGEGRSFLKFDTSAIPGGVTIDSAMLGVATDEERASIPRVGVYNVTQNWDTNTLRWSNQPTVAGSPEDSYAHNIVYAWWNFDVTNLVKNWYSGATPNYGISLRAQDPSISRRVFMSKHHSTVEFKPYLLVYYNAATTSQNLGLKSYWRMVSTPLAIGSAAVNTSNGNLVFNFNDVSAQGIGLDFGVSHTYNSQDDYNDRFGYGWTISPNKRLVPSQDRKTVLYMDETNTSYVFQDSAGDGNYVDNVFDSSSGFYRRPNHRPNGLNWGLKYNGGNSTYTVTTNNKNTLTFNSTGQITEERDRNGNTLAYNYSGGKLVNITNSAGKQVTFTYDGSTGKLIEIDDPNANDQVYSSYGGRVTYTYDGDDLKTLSFYTGSTLIGTTTFNYTNHRLISVVDARTNTTSFTYNNNKVTDIYDAENKRTGIEYTSAGLTKVTSAKGYDQGANPADFTTDYYYRTNAYYQPGLVYKEVTPPLKNDQNQTVRNTYLYDYNDDYFLHATTDPAGNTDASAYDDISGLLFYQFNENKGLTLKNTYSPSNYDSGNWLLADTYSGNGTQTSFTYDNNGNLLTKSVVDGNINFAHNPGFESTTRDPSAWDANCGPYVKQGVADFWCGSGVGSSNRVYAYDPSTFTDGLKSQSAGFNNGGGGSVNVFQEIDEATKLLPDTDYVLSWQYKNDTADNFGVQIAVIHYDSRGDQIGSTILDTKVSSNSWTGRSFTFHTPVQNGNGWPYWTSDIFMRAHTPTTGITAKAWFDTVRLEKGTIPSQGVEKKTSFTYTDIGHPTPTGLPLTETTPEGKTTSYDWDSNGNLTKSTDALGKFTTFTYDANGNKLTKTEPNGNETILDPDDYKTSFSYNGRGKILTVTEVKNNRQTTYQYDPNGNLQQSTTPNGLTTNYTYDKVNRAKQTTNPYGYVSNVTYDAQGNPQGVTDPNGRNSSSSYDAADRLTQETNSGSQNTNYGYSNVGDLKKTEEASKTLSYNYDNTGQLTSETNNATGTNKTIQYTYDNNGNLTITNNQTGETINQIYSATDEVTKVTVAGQTTTYTRNKNNQLTQLDKANSDVVTYGYNNNAQVTTITHKRSGQDFLKYDYVYDANGNRTTVTTTTGSVRQVTYEYDNLNQLKKIIAPEKTTTYTYDNGGNITRFEDTLGAWTNFTYDGNRLLKKYDSTGAVEYYSYDASGNLITRDTGDNISFLTHFNDNILNERDGQAGTVTGGVSYGPAKFSNGLQLGTNSYLNYPASGNFNRTRGTIEFWLPPTVWCGHCGTQTILDYTVDQSNYIRVKAYNLTNISFEYVVGGVRYGSASGHINRFGWQHVAFTWEPNNTEMYINGEYVPSGDDTIPPFPIGAQNLVIGASMTTTPSDYLISLIDELSISPEVKSGTEILADYNAQSERVLTHLTRYTYDDHDYLTKVTKSDGTVINYTYDSNKRLTKRTKTGAADINYQYDGDKLTAELNNDGSVINKYRYDTDGALVSVVNNGNTYYPVTDGLGSIVALRDANGNTANSYQYDEWGKLQNKTEAFVLPLRYAGYWYDDDASLYHLGARWYDPGIYRFLSVDPHPGDQDDSLSLNEYLYTASNPIVRTDPDGDYFETALDVASVVYSANEFKRNKSLKNAGWLAFDMVMLAMPIGTGSGAFRKAAKGWTSEQNFVKHYLKHGKGISAERYTKQAQKTIRQAIDTAKATGKTSYWDGKRLTVVNSKNKIITHFKTDQRYWKSVKRRR